MRLDPFLVLLLAMAGLGSFVPATGQGLEVVRGASMIGIAVLFFLYGARLSTAETLQNLRNWRLQSTILVVTFLAFPLLGLAVREIPEAVLDSRLAAGVLLLTLVPSTMQGCVVYTRIAGGNTAAAVVAASLSNLLGVFLVPVYVAVLMGGQSQVDGGAVTRILLQLLAPFVVGQLLRPVIGPWVDRYDRWLRKYDRGAILLIVFVAFSEAAAADIWSAVPLPSFAVVLAVCVAMHAAALLFTAALGRWGRFPPADRKPLLFCGATKSLASGLPMVSVLFTGPAAALLVLPLMIYHQLQLIAGSIIAERWARRDAAGPRG